LHAPRAGRARRAAMLAAAIGAASAGGAASADEVVLRAGARLSPEARVVRLADVARLDGPEAQRLADAVIAVIPQEQDSIELSVRAVREALDAAGAHWGKVNLCGRTVVVRLDRSAVDGAPLAMTPLSVNPEASPGPARHEWQAKPGPVPLAAAELLGEQTLRGEIARILLRGLAAEPREVRLLFEERDADLLSTPLERARFEIRPGGSLASDRVAIEVRRWDGDRAAEARTVQVRPVLRRGTSVAARVIERGHRIEAEDLRAEERWVAPGEALALCAPDEALGRTAAVRLRAGETISGDDLQREIVIRRGDRVIVRCLVGGLAISLEAEARGDAAGGEPIELRKLGERDTFSGIAAGPGEATVDLGRARRREGAVP
jgi:flagella basal body P-ring formation protein FlgA